MSWIKHKINCAKKRYLHAFKIKKNYLQITQYFRKQRVNIVNDIVFLSSKKHSFKTGFFFILKYEIEKRLFLIFEI